jgi:hypothetical protein
MRFVGRPILAAACFRAGFFDNPQAPLERRLQPPYNAAPMNTDERR